MEKKETQLRNRPTVDCTLEPIQHPGPNTVYMEDRSTFESEPAGKTKQIGTFYTLIFHTPMDKLRPQLEYVELQNAKTRVIYHS